MAKKILIKSHPTVVFKKCRDGKVRPVRSVTKSHYRTVKIKQK